MHSSLGQLVDEGSRKTLTLTRWLRLCLHSMCPKHSPKLKDPTVNKELSQLFYRPINDRFACFLDPGYSEFDSACWACLLDPSVEICTLCGLNFWMTWQFCWEQQSSTSASLLIYFTITVWKHATSIYFMLRRFFIYCLVLIDYLKFLLKYVELTYPKVSVNYSIADWLFIRKSKCSRFRCSINYNWKFI